MSDLSVRSASTATAWPDLQRPGWPETQASLHRLVQMLGKVRLALSPPQNHYWHATLYVSTRGLTTSPIPFGFDVFQIDLDFLSHQLQIQTSWGDARSFSLEPHSVADVYEELMGALRALGIDVEVWPTPVEIDDTTTFDHDTSHTGYDPDAAHTFWRALLQADRVFKQFRGQFRGKCSPVHFFWGAFDLAVTRFSGRPAPMWHGQALNVHPHVMHESYSQEVSSAGLWLGDASAPLFYSYAVPEPAGYSAGVAEPEGARYDSTMGEFVLPYTVVQTSDNPDDTLMRFLQTTYAAAADLGKWDRDLLDHRPACTCTPEELARLKGTP
jgi:hypothetical protein